MSRGADVLVVLVPEVEEPRTQTAALLGEAGRVAEALGGRVAAVELGGEDAPTSRRRRGLSPVTCARARRASSSCWTAT